MGWRLEGVEGGLKAIEGVGAWGSANKLLSVEGDRLFSEFWV